MNLHDATANPSRDKCASYTAENLRTETDHIVIPRTNTSKKSSNYPYTNHMNTQLPDTNQEPHRNLRRSSRITRPPDRLELLHQAQIHYGCALNLKIPPSDPLSYKASEGHYNFFSTVGTLRKNSTIL